MSLETSPSVCINLFSIIYLFIYFVFLRLLPWHMEVPRLGVKLERQLLAIAVAMPDQSHVCDLHHSSRQHWILNSLTEARDQTCVLTDASQIRFHCATTGTPINLIFKSMHCPSLDVSQYWLLDKSFIFSLPFKFSLKQRSVFSEGSGLRAP